MLLIACQAPVPSSRSLHTECSCQLTVTAIQDTQERRTEAFDALVVCNGHYSEPRIPAIPGSREFPGRQLHTHNFRENSGFAGQTVVVMGASASGQDIAREIAEVAKTVSPTRNPPSQASTHCPQM